MQACGPRYGDLWICATVVATGVSEPAMRQLHRHLEIIPQAPVRETTRVFWPSLYNHLILHSYNAQRETATDVGLCTDSAG
jgi:hypothetical protein